MRHFLTSAGIAVTVALAFVSLQAQSAKQTYKVPKTVDGQPDLTGNWSNATFTPLERPAAFAEKEFFTPEEAAAFAKSGIDRLNGQAADDVHYDDAIWQSENYRKGVSSLRTSL